MGDLFPELTQALPPPRPSKREARAQRFEEASRPFLRAAMDRKENLHRLAVTAVEMFRQMAPDAYPRRRPLALRIPVRDGLAAVVRPEWVYDGPLMVRVATAGKPVLIEPTLTREGRDGKPGHVIVAELRVAGASWSNNPTLSMVRSQHFPEYVEAMDVIDGFLDDPLGTFARSDAPNCGICGRALTDPSSRAQGIGPECIEKVDLFNAIAEARSGAALAWDAAQDDD